MSAVVIRVAGPDDVPVLAAFRRTWDVRPELGLPARDPAVEDPAVFDARFGEWFRGEHDRRTMWVAWAGSEPIGLSGLLEYRAMPTPGLAQRCWGYLGNMYVDAAHRNRRVGARLLEAAIAAADERGYVRLVLAPSARSVPFYRRAGFVEADPDLGGDRLFVRRRPAGLPPGLGFSLDRGAEASPSDG